MKDMTPITVIAVVVIAYILSTVIQIILTKSCLSKGNSFFKSGVIASATSFAISITIVFIFFLIMYLISE